MGTGWVDSLKMQEPGGGCYWVHNTSHLQKPLSTRMGVAGHVTSMEE